MKLKTVGLVAYVVGIHGIFWPLGLVVLAIVRHVSASKIMRAFVGLSMGALLGVIMVQLIMQFETGWDKVLLGVLVGAAYLGGMFISLKTLQENPVILYEELAFLVGAIIGIMPAFWLLPM